MPCSRNLDSSVIPRHADFYFRDGNIILVVERTCFRVHAGHLTRHSDVFRGMISLPQPEDAVTVDGCPTVVLHDTAQEVAHLLTALYDGLYFTEGKAIDFPALSAVLRLSTKYFFGRLRRHALVRLRADWPLTLAEWDVRERIATTSEGAYNPSITRTNPILIVNLARELCLPSFLAPAFYDLARYTPSQILGGSPKTQGCPKALLEGTDLMLVFRGKEAGQRFTSSFVSKELEDRDVAPWCRNIRESHSEVCRDAFGMVIYETLRSMSGLTTGWQCDPLFTLQRVLEMQKRETGTDVAQKLTARACEMCRADLQKATQRARQSVWESIPGWFEIDVATSGEEF